MPRNKLPDLAAMQFDYWIIDGDGNPVAIGSPLAWAEFMRSPDHVIAVTPTATGRLSTIYSGCFCPRFETAMIYTDPNKRTEIVATYGTKAEALEGHAELLKIATERGL